MAFLSTVGVKCVSANATKPDEPTREWWDQTRMNTKNSDFLGKFNEDARPPIARKVLPILHRMQTVAEQIDFGFQHEIWAGIDISGNQLREVFSTQPARYDSLHAEFI